MELHTAIFCASGIRFLRGEWLGFTFALGSQSAGCNSGAYQVCGHRLGSCTRECQIVLFLADAVGVALDFDEREVRVVLDQKSDLIEEAVALLKQVCRACLEVHLVLDEDAVV